MKKKWKRTALIVSLVLLCALVVNSVQTSPLPLKRTMEELCWDYALEDVDIRFTDTRRVGPKYYEYKYGWYDMQLRCDNFSALSGGQMHDFFVALGHIPSPRVVIVDTVIESDGKSYHADSRHVYCDGAAIFEKQWPPA